MAEMKIYCVDLIDDSWYYVFAKTARTALAYVCDGNYPDLSFDEFKREYEPEVRLMADNEIIEIEDDDEKTVAEWLASDYAKHPGCWLSNTYED
jgi:hypothetical protein